MKADDLSQNQALTFPLSLPAATPGLEVEGPTRFARALKRARFARGWTQARLAAQLAIPKRSIVSWETGERIPSVGMVMLLLDTLSPGEELSLHRELVTAYIADDLERQEQRREHQPNRDDPLVQRVQHVMAQVLQLPTSTTQAEPLTGHLVAEEQEPSRPHTKREDQHALEPLFALIEQLRQHPELIAVARDFIHELTRSE
jgi:transcriptional regulator with XRE-family HTH domain